jgi:protein ImuA
MASLIDGLPGPGFPYGVLNEVIAPYRDRAAAFGFLFAVVAVALREREGPALFVATERALDCGVPYGHGLSQLGVDMGRLILVETKTDKDALWAVEQALRSEVRPSVVVGATERELDLTRSRRLNLAAAAHATPLVLSECTKAAGTNAAGTRWRLASAPAAVDRFGMLAGWRWHATLERCRNGRTGEWLIEWDPAALRFRTAEPLLRQAHAASRSLARSPQAHRPVRWQPKHQVPKRLDLADIGDAPRRQKAI